MKNDLCKFREEYNGGMECGKWCGFFNTCTRRGHDEWIEKFEREDAKKCTNK